MTDFMFSIIFISTFLTSRYCDGANIENLFQYGQHFPNGKAAVDYIYGAEGTFKNTKPLQYSWNYYEHFATPNHPFDKEALISAANGNSFYTARDANGYLLCDFDKNLEIDNAESEFCGTAFHEHNGKGVRGQTRGLPFTQFWLDDNWLARYMSVAYNRPQPDGLVEQNGYMRWKVVGGDTTNWNPYNSDHFDTLSLDGLYHIARGEIILAISKWNRCLVKSGARYEDFSQQYNYPGIHENYHMGLWKMFTDFLLDHDGVTQVKKQELLQHSVSLRSQIMNNQELDSAGNPIGWISNIGDQNTLINTESVSVGALALAANARFVFEASKSPMRIGAGDYFVRPYNALSAVTGISVAGILSFGPGHPLSPGNYVIQFILRTPNPQDANGIAYVDVYDSSFTQIVTDKIVNSQDFQTANGNQWCIITLQVNIIHPDHLYEFRTYWYGTKNLDIAAIRIK